jgi:hypothetical protein
MPAGSSARPMIYVNQSDNPEPSVPGEPKVSRSLMFG